MNPFALGNKFLAVVSKDVAGMLFDEMTEMGLTGLDRQWVYMVADTNIGDTDVSDVLTRAVDGTNAAMVYNASQTSADSCQVSQNML